ncbi:hypothetical protein [Glaciibacter psychrotolerans]|uniref:Uncharacterized protein n=1 Tax=Glaciibacter psychrotolerans TaxID=670054 RepID=A0A7Z0EEC6_9MICO|nr:hypothetical protein [Leifsonia psychrotolerans]NYJ20096.1 hypothetical protein [Leifsonia psychrotolerans]
MGPLKKETNLYGLVSVLLGLVACLLPLSLPSAGGGFSGFAVTKAGVTALVFAARSASRFLSVIGATLGVVGTILCVWSLAAFYAPGSVPAAPTMATLTSAVQAAEPKSVGTVADVSGVGARVVAPVEGADVTAPADQLRANLRHVIFSLCIGLNFSRDHGDLPNGLAIAADGTISSATARYTSLPSDMHLSYVPASDGAAYKLTITDVESGIAVSYDSALNQVVDH